MNIVSWHVFNATRNQWLDDSEQAWGSWYDAAGFTSFQLCEDIRLRETKGDDATFTMAFAQ